MAISLSDINQIGAGASLVAFTFFGEKGPVIGVIDEESTTRPIRETLETPDIINETHNISFDVTQFPIESGSTISDHILNLPDTYTMTSIASDASISLYGAIRNALTEQPTVQAWDFFQLIKEKRYRLQITTNLKTYKSMAIRNISIERDVSTGSAFRFTIDFVEVRQVALQTATVSELSGREATNSKLGKQSTENATDSAGTGNRVSLLKRAIQ